MPCTSCNTYLLGKYHAAENPLLSGMTTGCNLTLEISLHLGNENGFHFSLAFFFFSFKVDLTLVKFVGQRDSSAGFSNGSPSLQ